jgi:hypothetical protein
MKPEQQRIAIAEACGWTETEAWLDGRRCFERAESNSGWDFDSLPDYLNDLNAMHEAEETLQESQRVTYSNELYDLAVEHQLKTGKWSYLSMTAAQRAEAFLRTIGKWEEAK